MRLRFAASRSALGLNPVLYGLTNLALVFLVTIAIAAIVRRLGLADGVAWDSVNKPVHKFTLLGANFLISCHQFIERAEMD